MNDFSTMELVTILYALEFQRNQLGMRGKSSLEQKISGLVDARRREEVAR